MDDSSLSVRIIHTFDRWTTDRGLEVAVGSGLTMKHFCRALQFLDGMCESRFANGGPEFSEGYKFVERSKRKISQNGRCRSSFVRWALKCVRSH